MALEIVSVAVPAPLHEAFDYLVPEDMNGLLQPGQRVQVPFGRRELVGVVVAPPRTVQQAEFRYKPIQARLDETPLLPSALLELCRWASGYYQHPLGEVLATALPGPLRLGRQLRKKASKHEVSAATPAPSLTAEQAAALAVLREGSGFRVFLIEGVTGSGKTELYLRRAADLLEAGRQVLMLVPEIGLAPQLLDRVRARFPHRRVAAYHSGMTEAERARVWLDAGQGTIDVLVGTRSAIFLPLPRLGLLVVDEEHDGSFKQQDGLRYHARDLGIVRARLQQAEVILGSATPSLESLHNAQAGRYRHLRLIERAQQSTLPQLRPVDVRGVPLRNGLAPAVLDALERHLVAGGQALLFLNRRGYAPVLLCHDCGWTAQCRHCDARMTLHRGRRRLLCHHCGSQAPVPASCADCGRTELLAVGQGTERIEEALQIRFPQYRVERFDSDRMAKRGEWERLLREVREGQVRILVGTQMLAKGHDFADLSLVVIVDVDQALYGTDFRALERMAQTVTQVAGRAGRAERIGEVLLQTHVPEHPVLQQLVQGGYGALCRALLAERRGAGLPPFGHLVLLRAEARDPGAPLAFLEEAAQRLRALASPDLNLAGPAPAPMERRAGRVRAQLLLLAARRAPLQRILAQVLPELRNLPAARRVRWSVDVDPADLF